MSLVSLSEVHLCRCCTLRAATVITMTYCELYSLRRSDLEQVVSEWPELAEEFAALGEAGALIKLHLVSHSLRKL